ncbi:terminase-like family [Leptolyngbya sp. Heron Island J]|uniref:phage terminase large subunit family protein n=1 Tax=Leptolyngbya sp. Heron Island J TaxID=1385935 RepID=UPI0003B9667F|nr:terminase-like family [Leptolyngbya sp. Heron Island J]ESA35939.1 terminase-like family [Leptolyngbya sp. Heron Island J]
MLPDTFPEFCQHIKIKSLEGIQPFTLLDWQQRFSDLILTELAQQKASISVMKSRQVGNTLLVLVMELWLSLIIPQHTSLVLHLTYTDAWNLCRRLRKLIKQMNIPMVTDSLSLLEFSNGSTIYFRSADPETCGRGLENVDFLHIEEQGHQPHLKETLEVISPMRTWSPYSKLVLIGTPNGKQPHYYDLLRQVIPENTITQTVEGIRAGVIDPYQVFKSDRKYAILLNWRTIQRFREEIEPTFLERVQAEENLTDIGILTEYELEFSESESAVFSPVLVRSAEIDQTPVRQSIHTGEVWYQEPDQAAAYYVGGDPNAGSLTSGDAAALIVLRQDGDTYKIAYIYRKKSGTSAAHVSRWADAIQAFSPLETRIESNNTGLTWIEQLAALCPTQAIEASKTTESTRPQLITLLTLALERGHLKVPVNSHISRELLSFVVNANGKPEAAQGSNDDVIFALMHALKAANYGQSNEGSWV